MIDKLIEANSDDEADDADADLRERNSP